MSLVRKRLRGEYLERANPAVQLTERELLILTFIQQNKSNREIAEYLHVSPTRIEVFVRRIKRKTGVRSRRELETFEAGQEK